MAQVIVRHLDNDVVDALKQRAKRHKRSLEQELRDILMSAAKPTRSEALELADAVRARSLPQHTDSTELLREDRDHR